MMLKLIFLKNLSFLNSYIRVGFKKCLWDIVHSKNWFINCIKEPKIKKQMTSFCRYEWVYIGWPKGLSPVLPQQNQN